MFGFRRIDVPFYLVAYPRSLVKKNEILFNKLSKTIYNLSLVYNIVIYDNPLILTEEEGIEFTKNALENKKNLRGIIFALDDEICTEEDVSLKLCLEFCHEKDKSFSGKLEKNLRVYGLGFNRLLISLSDNPAQLIANLNGKYPFFYDPNKICFSFDNHFSENNMSKKLFSSILNIEKYYIRFLNLKQNKIPSVKKISIKKEKVFTKKCDKALKWHKNNYMVIVYVDEIRDQYIEYLKDKDIDRLFLVSINDQEMDIYYNGNLYSSIHMLNDYYLFHSSHPLYRLFSVFSINRRSDRDARITSRVYKEINKYQNLQKLTFISYSHRDNKDEKKITAFANELKTIGINVFLDEFNFIPGQDWEEVAYNTIKSKECKYMICVISEAYLKSISCKKEVVAMLENNKKIILFDPTHLINDQTDFYAGLLKRRKVRIVYSRLELIKRFGHFKIDSDLSFVDLESNYFIEESDRELAQKILIKDCNYNGDKPIKIIKSDKEYFVSIEDEEFKYIKSRTDARAFFINNEKKIYKSDCKKKIISYKRMKEILSRKPLIINFLITTLVCIVLLFLIAYLINNDVRDLLFLVFLPLSLIAIFQLRLLLSSYRKMKSVLYILSFLICIWIILKGFYGLLIPVLFPLVKIRSRLAKRIYNNIMEINS
ncbi:MAG: TIR domain-containing protein [Anaeroplasmataceae bacterium]